MNRAQTALLLLGLATSAVANQTAGDFGNFGDLFDQAFDDLEDTLNDFSFGSFDSSLDFSFGSLPDFSFGSLPDFSFGSLPDFSIGTDFSRPDFSFDFSFGSFPDFSIDTSFPDFSFSFGFGGEDGSGGLFGDLFDDLEDAFNDLEEEIRGFDKIFEGGLAGKGWSAPAALDAFADELPEIVDCDMASILATCNDWDLADIVTSTGVDFDVSSGDLHELEMMLEELDWDVSVDVLCPQNSVPELFTACLDTARLLCGEEDEDVEEAIEDFVEFIHESKYYVCGEVSEFAFEMDYDMDDMEDMDGYGHGGGRFDFGLFDLGDFSGIFDADSFCFNPERPMAGECHGNGVCIEGFYCECFPGYAGLFCGHNEDEFFAELFGGCPTDEFGEECSGQGFCNEWDICECDEGFFGFVCELDEEGRNQMNAHREQETHFWDIFGGFESFFDDCDFDSVICPPSAGDLSGECVASLADCGIDNADVENERAACAELAALGDFENISDDCAFFQIPQKKCPEDTPVRCSDGSCRALDGTCPDDGCGEGLVGCGDGYTCAEDEYACVWDFGVYLEGCGPEMVPCDFDQFECAPSLDECLAITGCAADTPLACSIDYSESGTPVIQTNGNIGWVCAADRQGCKDEYGVFEFNFDTVQQVLNAGEELFFGDVAGITIPEGLDNISFTINDIAANIVSSSGFKDLILSSSVTEITPGAVLDQPVNVTIAVNQKLVNGSCAETIAKLDPRKIENVRNPNDTVKDAGKCIDWVESGPNNCACIFQTTGFSTVALADVTAEASTSEAASATETSAAVADTVSTTTTTTTTTTPTTTTTTTTTGSPAGSVTASFAVVMMSLVVLLL